VTSSRDIAGEEETEGPTVTLGNLRLNLESLRVTVEGRFVDLTYREFELLRILAARPERVIPYEALAREMWGVAGRGAIRHLNVIVHRLRTKLSGFHPYAIETVRGRGYGLLRPSPVT
jgi:DNA-binding response OmpR family regulator